MSPLAQTPYIVTRGIVLRQTETKEADKILTLLTPDAGKISVIARGARRKSCKYAACAQALAYSEWTLYQKGDWYYANDASPLELFTPLQLDLTAMALGFYFAEVTEAVTTADQPCGELLRHLLNGLYALAHMKKPPRLVRPAFEVRLLSLAGYEPLADSCAYCGQETPRRPMLDITQGVVRCAACGKEESGTSVPLDEAALAALRHCLYGDPKRLYSFRLEEESLRLFQRAAEGFLTSQLERGFRTLDFYKSLI